MSKEEKEILYQNYVDPENDPGNDLANDPEKIKEDRLREQELVILQAKTANLGNLHKLLNKKMLKVSFDMKKAI